MCLKGRGVAPPALCGGPVGYRLMLRRQRAGPTTAGPSTAAATVGLLAVGCVDEDGIEHRSDLLSIGRTEVDAAFARDDAGRRQDATPRSSGLHDRQAGFRAEYGEGFSVGYLRDPQGNEIALFCDSPAEPSRRS